MPCEIREKDRLLPRHRYAVSLHCVEASSQGSNTGNKCPLYTYNSFDGGPGVVIFEGEILKFEGKDILNVRIDNHAGQFSRSSRELLFHLVEMVEIDMSVACGVYELSGLQAAYLRHHHAQESV